MIATDNQPLSSIFIAIYDISVMVDKKPIIAIIRWWSMTPLTVGKKNRKLHQYHVQLHSAPIVFACELLKKKDEEKTSTASMKIKSAILVRIDRLRCAFFFLLSPESCGKCKFAHDNFKWTVDSEQSLLSLVACKFASHQKNKNYVTQLDRWQTTLIPNCWGKTKK